MPTIYKTNSDHISIADAKRLILEAVPHEDSVGVYRRLDENGNIDFDGPIEVRKNLQSNALYALHIHRDFPEDCKQLCIVPRWKYRPSSSITDYKEDGSQDEYYYITHDEFVKYATRFRLSVAIGSSLEQAAPEVEVPANEPRLAATGPEFTKKRDALINDHIYEWQSIKGDLNDASANGLSKSAKVPGQHGMWFVERARTWATERGKLAKPKTSETPRNLMIDLPGKMYGA